MQNKKISVLMFFIGWKGPVEVNLPEGKDEEDGIQEAMNSVINWETVDRVMNKDRFVNGSTGAAHSNGGCAPILIAVRSAGLYPSDEDVRLFFQDNGQLKELNTEQIFEEAKKFMIRSCMNGIVRQFDRRFLVAAIKALGDLDISSMNLDDMDEEGLKSLMAKVRPLDINSLSGWKKLINVLLSA